MEHGNPHAILPGNENQPGTRVVHLVEDSAVASSRENSPYRAEFRLRVPAARPRRLAPGASRLGCVASARSGLRGLNYAYFVLLLVTGQERLGKDTDFVLPEHVAEILHAVK